MAEFVVHDTLKVLTQNGECCIELCLGDITKLKRKDKVDVIMVSSFRGNIIVRLLFYSYYSYITVFSGVNQTR